MGGRTIGGIALAVLVFGFVFWSRTRERSDDSAQIRGEAMQILSTMEGYEQHESILQPMADRAHSVAFDQAYKMRERRTAAKFDEEKYLQAFFRSMVSQANDLNRQDLKKAILALRSDIEEAGEPEAHDNKSEAAAASPPDGSPSSDETLTTEKIVQIADEELEQQLFDAISQELGRLTGDEKAAVRKLSKGKRMLYVTWRAESEVNNGGFDQFFVNSTAPLAKHVVLGFEAAKAKKHAKLMKRAIAAFVRANPDQKEFKVDKSVKKYMESYPDTDLAKIDDEFFKLKENLSELRIKYIRAHPQEFVIEQE